jgi:hypothetical protein
MNAPVPTLTSRTSALVPSAIFFDMIELAISGIDSTVAYLARDSVRYDLKSSERQRLAITLPNPRSLGVSVAGQTVAPEKAPADVTWNLT